MVHIVEAEFTRNNLIPPAGKILLCKGSELARLLFVALQIVFTVSAIRDVVLQIGSESICRGVNQNQILRDAMVSASMMSPSAIRK